MGPASGSASRGSRCRLLLVAVGPILISSFTFNFNNFNVIYLFNEGGPPIPNTPTPAGHTDILITYVYRLAFAGGRGADYAYAAAITVIIFVILVVLTIFNFRFTRIWEEVGENV
jgi:arabinogalactan oligomer / maltooligosaccharide transport system permease protein